jgi:hypothetical protein
MRNKFQCTPDIVALGEDSMSVQYPGCRAAILGVIHHHCLDTTFIFIPEIYCRIDAFLPIVCVATHVQIKVITDQINRKWNTMVHIKRR